MKNSKIGAICKKSKAFAFHKFFNSDGEVIGQWVGNGQAAYNAEELPEINKNVAFAMWDIAEKDADKYSVQETEERPGYSIFTDYTAKDKLLEKGMSLYVGSDRWLALHTADGGVLFIDTAYLAPLVDEAEYQEFYERDGMIIVKSGMQLRAVIAAKTVTEELADKLNDLNNRLKFQIAIGRVNKETGEIEDTNEGLI